MLEGAGVSLQSLVGPSVDEGLCLGHPVEVLPSWELLSGRLGETDQRV